MTQIANGYASERKSMLFPESGEEVDGGCPVLLGLRRYASGGAERLKDDILGVLEVAGLKALIDECLDFGLGDLYGHRCHRA